MQQHLPRWIAILFVTLSSPVVGQIAVGEPFPDLALPTLDGETRSVSDYLGQKVILHVFASW